MALKKKSRSAGRRRLRLTWQAFAVAAAIAAVLGFALSPLVTGSPVQRTIVSFMQQAIWAVAAACAVLSAAAYGVQRYKARKANPYARLRLDREPRFDTPRVGRRAAALAVGDSIIRIRELPKMPRADAWSAELLRAIEWKHFDMLCAAYYGHRHFRVENSGCTPDGGTAATMYFRDLPHPVAALACKAWGGRPVGVKAVRDMLAAMNECGVAKGIVHASAECTNEARAFAHANRIQIVSGSEFVAHILKLPEAVQKALLDLATAGDYRTPVCPACGEKMLMCTSDEGDFWGCSGYPQCKVTLAAVHATW